MDNNNSEDVCLAAKPSSPVFESAGDDQVTMMVDTSGTTA